jgi:hypothetical protein
MRWLRARIAFAPSVISSLADVSQARATIRKVDFVFSSDIRLGRNRKLSTAASARALAFIAFDTQRIMNVPSSSARSIRSAT